LTAIEVRWFQADSAQQQVDPFVGGELVATCTVLFEVECRELDRL
jgi:hypothetical protein